MFVTINLSTVTTILHSANVSDTSLVKYLGHIVAKQNWKIPFIVMETVNLCETFLE